jgi:hypothetical protein
MLEGSIGKDIESDVSAFLIARYALQQWANMVHNANICMYRHCVVATVAALKRHRLVT